MCEVVMSFNLPPLAKIGMLSSAVGHEKTYYIDLGVKLFNSYVLYKVDKHHCV